MRRFRFKISTNALIIIILISAITLIYSKTWWYHNYVNYDDPIFLDNPNVKNGLSFQSIKWAFTDATSQSDYWIPITWLSFIVDAEIFGNNYGGFHFTNIVIHTINSILLFIFCLKIFKLIFPPSTSSIFPSIISSFLFAAHPIHVESVAWITCRKDMLFGFFWILGLIAYLEYIKNYKIYLDHQSCSAENACENRGIISYKNKTLFLYLVTLCLFIMGLMSKPMMLTFPFVLLLLDFYPFNRVNIKLKFSEYKKDIIKIAVEKFPFIFVILIFCISTYFFQKKGNCLEHYTLASRFFNSFIAYTFYIKKALMPIDLTILYPYPKQILPLTHALSIFLILFITIVCIFYKNKYPLSLVCWLWFLGTLVPVIGIYNVGNFLYTDRYAYIPLIGIYLIIGYLVENLIRKKPNKKKFVKLITIMIISVFIFISFMQVSYWKNSFTLLKRAIQINPESSLAYNNLGWSFIHIGKFEEAKKYLATAISLEPNFSLPYYNLASIFYFNKQYSKAIQFYKKTVALNPEYSMAYLDMGICYININSYNQAIKSLRKFIELKPDSPASKTARYFLEKAYNLKKVYNVEKNYDVETENKLE